MKANELMLGDLVTFKDCQYDDEIIVIKICQINQENNAFVFIDDSESLDEISIDEEIVGIPLTAEILEKNGFDDWFEHSKIAKSSSISNNHTNITIQMIEGDTYLQFSRCGGNSCEVKIHIRYVHELQHALKLCKIDKEIVL